jgi:hypothetical protein
MGPNGKRLIGVAASTVVVVVLIVLYISMYLTSSPGAASAAAITSGGTVNLYLATTASADPADAHPTWVSYYAVDAQSGHWHHATTFDLPAHSVIHVTIYQYDGQSGLRNPFISQARGIIGGSFNLDGHPVQAIQPDAASHIFAIPELGVSVPLEGVSPTAKNPCAQAPCGLSQDHHTIQFTFRTGAKGLYRWQCFVPCAAGFISGWGGPMQTVGYMDGYIHVV